MATSHKLDLEKIINSLGKSQNALDFAKKLHSLLFFDKISLANKKDYAQPGFTQYEILERTRNNCKELLKSLQLIRKNIGNCVVTRDFDTAPLIWVSRSIINKEDSLRNDMRPLGQECVDSTKMIITSEVLRDVVGKILISENSDFEDNFNRQTEKNQSVPFCYIDTLFDFIEELAGAVDRAAKSVAPERGKKTDRKQDAIRMHFLAQGFVCSYWACFEKYPPTGIGSKKYNAYCIFVDFLCAAGLARPITENVESHIPRYDYCLKKAIKEHKNTYGKYEALLNQVRHVSP